MALSELNQELTSLINREGGRAVGLDGQDGRFIRARPISPPDDDPSPPDLGFVGDVESIDSGLIDLLLSRDFVPVVMPIGVSADNRTYHINSDGLPGQVARALEAEKLVLMTNIAGVIGRDGALVPILTASEADALLRDRVVHGGMEPRLVAAVRAVREGVRSVHIVDGSVAQRAAARGPHRRGRGHRRSIGRGARLLRRYQGPLAEAGMNRPSRLRLRILIPGPNLEYRYHNAGKARITLNRQALSLSVPVSAAPLGRFH